MNGESYIIPANSKKSMMILGLFTPVDLAIFLIGCSFTLFALLLIKSETFSQTVIILLPALISAFLVAPIPNYHNVLQLLTNIILFFINQRKYKWKGWCITDDED